MSTTSQIKDPKQILEFLEIAKINDFSFVDRICKSFIISECNQLGLLLKKSARKSIPLYVKHTPEGYIIEVHKELRPRPDKIIGPIQDIQQLPTAIAKEVEN